MCDMAACDWVLQRSNADRDFEHIRTDLIPNPRCTALSIPIFFSNFPSINFPISKEKHQICFDQRWQYGFFSILSSLPPYLSSVCHNNTPPILWQIKGSAWAIEFAKCKSKLVSIAYLSLISIKDVISFTKKLEKAFDEYIV